MRKKINTDVVNTLLLVFIMFSIPYPLSNRDKLMYGYQNYCMAHKIDFYNSLLFFNQFRCINMFLFSPPLTI